MTIWSPGLTPARPRRLLVDARHDDLSHAKLVIKAEPEPRMGRLDGHAYPRAAVALDVDLAAALLVLRELLELFDADGVIVDWIGIPQLDAKSVVRLDLEIARRTIGPCRLQGVGMGRGLQERLPVHVEDGVGVRRGSPQIATPLATVAGLFRDRCTFER
jgi:hypothetical protein